MSSLNWTKPAVIQTLIVSVLPLFLAAAAWSSAVLYSVHRICLQPMSQHHR